MTAKGGAVRSIRRTPRKDFPLFINSNALKRTRRISGARLAIDHFPSASCHPARASLRRSALRHNT
jgi:hypothetical protein